MFCFQKVCTVSNIASLAILHAKVPTFASPLDIFLITASTDNNPEQSIDEDGKALEELPKGRWPVASCAVTVDGSGSGGSGFGGGSLVSNR